jgi:hypothetical protein
MRQPRSYVIGGSIDSTINVPDLYVAAHSGTQAVTLVQAIARIESGTSIDVQVRRNGTAVGSPVTVTSTKQTFTFSQALSDGDALDLSFANPVGSPTDLGFTLVLESVVTG